MLDCNPRPRLRLPAPAEQVLCGPCSGWGPTYLCAVSTPPALSPPPSAEQGLCGSCPGRPLGSALLVCTCAGCAAHGQPDALNGVFARRHRYSLGRPVTVPGTSVVHVRAHVSGWWACLLARTPPMAFPRQTPRPPRPPSFAQPGHAGWVLGARRPGAEPSPCRWCRCKNSTSARVTALGPRGWGGGRGRARGPRRGGGPLECQAWTRRPR